MAAVSETIVREYFELNGFLVRQHRKHVSPTRRVQDDDIDFFVLNPNPEPRPGDFPFILRSAELRVVDKAIVVVKGWHTETFSQARLENTPEIFRFVEQKTFQQAARAFGANGNPLKILVIPALPLQKTARDQSIALLRSRGIDAVIAFETILAELISAVEPNRNYQKSDLLQILRILKNYELFREPQMELFKTRSRRKKRSSSKAGSTAQIHGPEDASH